MDDMYKLTLQCYDFSVLCKHLIAISNGYKSEVVELVYLPSHNFRIRILNEAVEIKAYGYWPEIVYSSWSIIAIMKRSMTLIKDEIEIVYDDNKVRIGPLTAKAYTLANNAQLKGDPLACLVKIETQCIA